MIQQTDLGGKLNLSGTLLFHDATGAVIKAVDFVGSVPLSDLPEDQVQALIEQHKEQAHGPDHR